MSHQTYAIVYERGERNWGAYAPDLPGCGSVGDTFDECQANMKEAIEFHIEGLKLEGLPVPEPKAKAGYLEVVA